MNPTRCARCARTITPDEFEDGLVVETERGFYCGDCAVHAPAYDDAPTPPRPKARPAGGADQPGARRRFAGEVGDDAEQEEQDEQDEREGPEEYEEPGPADAPVEAPRPAPQQDDDPVALLRSILDELRAVSQALMYEKSSVWNTLGTVAQVFALATLLLAIARWAAAPLDALLLAIFLQAAALTFFVKGK